MSLAALRKAGWLSSQPASFQDEVLRLGRIRRYEQGATVVSIGDPPGGLIALVEGALAVFIAPGDTGPHFAHLASPGCWFGEGGFFTGGPRRLTLEVTAESVVFHLPLDAMERLAAADPENMRRFGCIALQNIDLCLEAIDTLLIADPKRRIAATLLRCIGESATPRIAMSQSALGRSANASRKVVNRTLGELAEMGLIEPGYAQIVIRDVARLKAFHCGDWPSYKTRE